MKRNHGSGRAGGGAARASLRRSVRTVSPKRTPTRTSVRAPSRLIEECRERSIELLRANLTPAGIAAATPSERSAARRYTAIFGRDAAICALGMAASGDPALEAAAVTGLETLAAHQAPNGQIPKFVEPAARDPEARAPKTRDPKTRDPEAREPEEGDAEEGDADFWYLGCIDSTLWWLIALAQLDAFAQPAGLRAGLAAQIDRALHWLRAQEHQRFFLLQQNEASDWADIMPRSGFVLYTNALWYLVKRLYGVERAEETRASFNSLFHPFSAEVPQYRRARLLNDAALRGAKHRDLYLSFVNFSFFGDEGDVFGNLLGVLSGAMPPDAEQRTLDALLTAAVHEPYPVRAVVEPIRRDSALWRPYMARHRQNFEWQYHNGGIWPMIGGFWIEALCATGRHALAEQELGRLAAALERGRWRFSEWLHGGHAALRGMPGQSWNAAAFLLAERAVRGAPGTFAALTRLAETQHAGT